MWSAAFVIIVGIINVLTSAREAIGKCFNYTNIRIFLGRDHVCYVGTFDSQMYFV